MKKLLLLAMSMAFFVPQSFGEKKDPVDYVNPYIGNISHLLVPTFATIQLPNSMMRIYPARQDYTTERMGGLPVIVTNHRERSAFSISPWQKKPLQPVASLTWDQEKLTPYSWDVELDDNSMRAQLAVEHQSAIYELSFYDTKLPVYLTVNSANGEMWEENGIIMGYQALDRRTKVYMAIELAEKPRKIGALENGNIGDATRAKGRDACLAVEYPAGTGRVDLRYGVSFISAEQALKNLRREQPGKFNREAVAKAGRDEWNRTLSNIKVEGGTEDQRTVLYTSYYRTFERPVCLSEDGRYYSAFDGKVHDDDGHQFYSDDWIWDTYRAAHPLRALIEPEKEEDIIESYLRMAEQMGTQWMPTFPEITGDTRRMNSNHGVAMVADALYKGLDVDAERAYLYCRKGIEEKTLAPWSKLDRRFL